MWVTIKKQDQICHRNITELNNDYIFLFCSYCYWVSTTIVQSINSIRLIYFIYLLFVLRISFLLNCNLFSPPSP